MWSSAVMCVLFFSLSYSLLLGSWCSSGRTKCAWSLFRATRKTGVSQPANEKTTASLKLPSLNWASGLLPWTCFLVTVQFCFVLFGVHCMLGNCHRLILLESLGKIKIFDSPIFIIGIALALKEHILPGDRIVETNSVYALSCVFFV